MFKQVGNDVHDDSTRAHTHNTRLAGKPVIYSATNLLLLLLFKKRIEREWESDGKETHFSFILF